MWSFRFCVSFSFVFKSSLKDIATARVDDEKSCVQFGSRLFSIARDRSIEIMFLRILIFETR